ncbi:methyl-accepting chemotaxis protein [Pseudomonas sp. DTU_2021_1001937_2_SI_NGA_ILE_001]|uniref:methyl-accepting chemotaxis protein n=1 Tax=Pseudomonas sp. DTU_2021_1001937_2_SI_NGA_ILE_001 TaxID=3077589 RepID=UPI0028FC210D|nr:methyl-accepting chemotaxis protein [Pseudomonas sp. DTU_2021_1001937_2_SI_NGA_ILE_001]WNW12912.1 methyl-accepting chemotaxis protein [Pseudomonas sp. DTU_2021_1001937_2_SI_NGA_ILE_001]
MLKNAPLRLKLLLILILPTLGFLWLATGSVIDNTRILRDMDATVDASASAQKLSQLITTLQRERGASGVFLGSKGTSMRDQLARMRQGTDQALTSAKALSTRGSELEQTLSVLDGLTTLRNQIDALGVTSTDSGARYTEIIQRLVGYTHSLEARINDPQIIHALSALNQFIEMKERAGRERVVLGLAFSQGSFDAPLLSRFSRNLGEFTAYAENFRRKAPAELLAQLDERMKDASAQEVSRLQRLAFELPLGTALGIKPEAWFETATRRIDLMGEVENNLGLEVRALAQDARDHASLELWLTVAAALAALVAVGVLSYLIIRNIDLAVRDVTSTLQSLSQRDLTARSSYRSRDEFGRIATDLNDMAAQITHIVQEISNATAQVATAAEESSAVTVETSRSVEQQRQSTELVATAITEMSTTVRDVARSTNDAAQMSQQISRHTTQGRSEVEHTIGLIRELSNQAEETARIIGELKQESDAISSVLDVIRSIAEQTNLLALNAAIEAARAGEAGCGFAVVADEVRNLAQKTQQSTGSIQQMISNLQNGSDRASQSMQETLGKAQAGANNIVRAGALLDEIAEGVTSISDRNIQIASAAEEQSAVAEDISRNVNEINDLVIQVSAGAQQTAVTSQELARLAEHQQDLVKRFKVA